MTNLNNILAEQAARDAKASKALGFAAMVYLPITSLAVSSFRQPKNKQRKDNSNKYMAANRPSLPCQSLTGKPAG